MGTNTGTIMTLANSIIGVSVLAMPFCFKQCGIALSIIMLIASSLLSRLACHFLLKSAVMARRRTFEFLAFHTFGVTGKFAVELFIIGFLMGTCIAFFVVMGDLGPAIVAKIIGLSNTVALRPSVLIGLAVFVVLPLGMLRNVDSLSSVSMATIGFYICLVLKVVGESLPHLLAGDWYEHVYFWRPAGILQCIPIFSMALFCQTQLFEIYESMHNASLDRMNFVIRAACNICTGVYICVGFFGYIAFCTQPFTGNVLMSFTPSIASEMIKLGFVLSVAVSFPLVIFPCRASLYSLLFRRISMPHHENVGSHIPEARFKCLTIFIISVALVIGILIPNIELVLGLVGSTIGVLICVMFPAAAFICMSTKSSSDRLLAQVLLFVGALILVLGTYATLNTSTETTKPPTEILINEPAPGTVEKTAHFHEKVVNSLVDVPPKLEQKSESNVKQTVEEPKEAAVADGNANAPAQPRDMRGEANKADKRQEPPVPMEPAAVRVEPTAIPHVKEEKVLVRETGNEVKQQVMKELKEQEKNAEHVEEINKKDIKSHGGEQVHQDAIKKEEEELAEAEKREDKNKNEEILRKLEKHEAQQMKILEEQKQILQALQEHQERDLLKERENSDKNMSQNKNIDIQEPAQVVKNSFSEIKVETKKNKDLNGDSSIQFPEKKKPDLLQQIANGELNKNSANSPLKSNFSKVNDSFQKPPISENQIKSIPGDNLFVNKLEPAVPDVKESLHVEVPAPMLHLKSEEPVPAVPHVLLERLRSPPLPLVLHNKTKVVLGSPSKAHDEALVAQKEMNAMRREILQEPVASTLLSIIPANVKNTSLQVKQTLNLSEQEQRQELHDREKRDIEDNINPESIKKMDVELNTDQKNIKEKVTLSPDLENCHITEQSESSDLKHNNMYKKQDILSFQEESPSSAPASKDVDRESVLLLPTLSPDPEHAKLMKNLNFQQSAGNSTKIEEKALLGDLSQAVNSNHSSHLNPASKDAGVETMIKSASHLSDPHVKSNEGNEVSILEKSVSPDAKPMKRDLKSISLSEEKSYTSRKQD